jgi:hypothetical protein
VFALGFGEIDERNGNLLPFAAFGAEVADAIALHLIFANEMIAAIFQVEFESLAEQERRREQQQQNNTHATCIFSPPQRAGSLLR